jgi:hypothetical protein
MKEELELQLVKKYPKIFRNYKGDPTKTCMAWGMPCGNGWYDILDRTCEKLSKTEGVYAEQIKEKFGTLRFYIAVEEKAYKNDKDLWKKANRIVEKAEIESETTCEDCGGMSEGVKSFSGWLYGICGKCFEEMKKKRIKFVCSCGKECTEYDYDKEAQLCWECKG